MVLGAIVCMGMGIWQLARYQEASGTVQNLGYTFMWPFLAGFLVYAYYKYIRLEADEAAESVGDGDGDELADPVGHEPGDDDDEVTPPPRGSRPRGRSRTRSSVATAIPEDILPTRRPTPEPVQDEGLRAYNSYLAELARQDGALEDRSQENPQR